MLHFVALLWLVLLGYHLSLSAPVPFFPPPTASSLGLSSVTASSRAIEALGGALQTAAKPSILMKSPPLGSRALEALRYSSESAVVHSIDNNIASSPAALKTTNQKVSELADKSLDLKTITNQKVSELADHSLDFIWKDSTFMDSLLEWDRSLDSVNLNVVGGSKSIGIKKKRPSLDTLLIKDAQESSQVKVKPFNPQNSKQRAAAEELRHRRALEVINIDYQNPLPRQTKSGYKVQYNQAVVSKHLGGPDRGVHSGARNHVILNPKSIKLGDPVEIDNWRVSVTSLNNVKTELFIKDSTGTWISQGVTSQKVVFEGDPPMYHLQNGKYTLDHMHIVTKPKDEHEAANVPKAKL